MSSMSMKHENHLSVMADEVSFWRWILGLFGGGGIKPPADGDPAVIVEDGPA